MICLEMAAKKLHTQFDQRQRVQTGADMSFALTSVQIEQYVEQLQNGNCYEVVESLEVACLKFAMSNLPQERTVVAQGPRYLAVHELHDKAWILANFKFSHAYVL